MTAPLRKPSTAINWYPHCPATESAIIDMANSRQIALRERLRNLYWLTECRILSSVSVALTRKKMAMIDPADTMTDSDVAEVLSNHYGFQTVPDGWTIPDLDEARGVAVKSGEVNRSNGAKGGRAKALKAAPQVVPVEPPEAEPAEDPLDF